MVTNKLHLNVQYCPSEDICRVGEVHFRPGLNRVRNHVQPGGHLTGGLQCVQKGSASIQRNEGGMASSGSAAQFMKAEKYLTLHRPVQHKGELPNFFDHCVRDGSA